MGSSGEWSREWSGEWAGGGRGRGPWGTRGLQCLGTAGSSCRSLEGGRLPRLAQPSNSRLQLGGGSKRSLRVCRNLESQIGRHSARLAWLEALDEVLVDAVLDLHRDATSVTANNLSRFQCPSEVGANG